MLNKYCYIIVPEYTSGYENCSKNNRNNSIKTVGPLQLQLLYDIPVKTLFNTSNLLPSAAFSGKYSIVRIEIA